MPDLQTNLLKLGYLDLFMRQTHDNLEQIWSQPDAPEQLLSLALNPDASLQARLLASEILFVKDKSFPPYQARPDLVNVYCEGLKSASIGNVWALPGHFTGILGKHLLGFGQLALPPLYALLDDERVIPYEGSIEATTGNRLKVRVKDLAGFFVSQIKRIPFEVGSDINTRDHHIDTLKNSS